MRKFPLRRTRTRWASRAEHLHWIAAGDQLPNWVYSNSITEWVWDHLWPEMTVHRLICRRYGHDLNDYGGKACCVWCDFTERKHYGC